MIPMTMSFVNSGCIYRQELTMMHIRVMSNGTSSTKISICVFVSRGPAVHYPHSISWCRYWGFLRWGDPQATIGFQYQVMVQWITWIIRGDAALWTPLRCPAHKFTYMYKYILYIYMYIHIYIMYKAYIYIYMYVCLHTIHPSIYIYMRTNM